MKVELSAETRSQVELIEPHVRRLLLRRTHHHLYFVEQRAMVYVVAVWGACRGRGPRL